MKLRDFYQQCWFSDVLNQNSTKRDLVEILRTFVDDKNIEGIEVFPTEDCIFVYVEDNQESKIKMPKHGDLHLVAHNGAYDVLSSCTMDYAEKVVNLYLSNSKYYQTDHPLDGLELMRKRNPLVFEDFEPDQD